MIRYTVIILFLIISNISAQLDTVKGDWPFAPFTSSLRISATFAEFRNTQSSDHFHNAADVPEPDGNPCYPSLDGTVYYKANDGSNSYIRVATKVGNEWKHLTYLHVVPNPALAVGDSVKKGKTILGTIASGMGHVHLIERELVSSITTSGVEINNLRKNGGLTPFVDTWAPNIDANSLKFYTNGGADKLDANALFGKVDIQVKIEEINGSSSVDRNNGTYIAGYRIWNEAKTEVVLEPNDSGVKYKFDYKPLDSYVHNAFVKNVATLSDPVYWLTNGNGAKAINSSRVVSDNYFDAAALPKGNYQLEIFAEDTRDNKSNKFFPISITDPKPKAPLVYELLNIGEKEVLTIKWKSNDESDVIGYRLYYATNSGLTDWSLAADETQLLQSINEYKLNSYSEFKNPPSNLVHYFALVAVDIAGQESDKSSIYTRSDFTTTADFPKALIVNAFTKLDEEDEIISHNYVTSYFNGLSATDSILISSISNRVFLDNLSDVKLTDYDIVLWFTGDNTNHELTIQPKEMSELANYLVKGGNLLMSGSKIGYDLDERMRAMADTLFYFHYLKAKYVGIGDGTIPPALGESNTVFDGIELNFGQTFEEKYPDDIDPNNGSEVLLTYKTNRNNGSARNAAVGYKGKFGTGTIDGKMIYVSFPIESLSSAIEQQNFFKSVLQYFGMITDISSEHNSFPIKYELSQNYPNPFNPSTKIKYTIPYSVKNEALSVNLTVYDILGREIKTLVNEKQKAGSYEVIFNANSLSSGVYFARLKSGNFIKSISMLLIK